MTANFVFPFGLGFHLSFPCVAEENPLNDDVPDKQRPPSVPPVQCGGRSLFINTLLNTACLFFSPLLLLKTLLDTNILWVAELELNCESICSSPREQLGNFFTPLAQRELILCLTMPRFECSFFKFVCFFQVHHSEFMLNVSCPFVPQPFCFS